MKKNKLIFCLMIGVLHTFIQAQEYIFPIQPGTTEWATLLTHNDMLKVCQVPDNYLKTMTTKDVIITCLNYPLKFDFYAYNNLIDGIKKVAANFNGLQELFSRKDNAECLFNIWQKTNIETLLDKTQYQRGELIVKQSLIEAFLTHEYVIVNATIEQQKTIAEIAMKNMELKEQHPKWYSSKYSLGTSAYLLCTILKRINNGAILSPELESFLDIGTLESGVQIEELKQTYYNTLMK